MGEQIEVAIEIGAGEHFEDEIDATPCGVSGDVVHVVGGFVIEDGRRAVAFDLLATDLAGRGAEDDRAAGGGELDGSGADSAARAVDEDGLAGLKGSAFEESAIGGGIGDRDSCALFEAEVGGEFIGVGGLDGGEFGVTAGMTRPARPEAEDATPGGGAFDDFAADFRAGDVGKRDGSAVGSAADVGIDRIDTDRANADKPFALVCDGVGDIFVPEHVRPAEFMDADGFHRLREFTELPDDCLTRDERLQRIIMADELAKLREKIDALDADIVRLLNERARVVVEVGRVKQATNEPIYAPDREKVVLEKVSQFNQGPLPDRCLRAVYRELMSGSFALERPLRIGFLGPVGTFSHQAAGVKFGASVDYVPLADIRSVFEEVTRGHIDYGMVPVENSIHGGVIDTLDAFLGSSARICAEVLITIHHNLLAREPWEKITRICSKPEVFTQCRNWLEATAKGREIAPVASTSRAAEMAATEPGTAAIASSIAARLHGLTTVFENIEDDPNNVTRFWVISREPAKRTGDDKTAILFTTSHKPGALAEVLDVFRDSGINLTDIEKRPSKKVNWEYFFFIDTQGHADDESMKRAISEAKKHCLQLSVLGSYPRATEVL